LALRAAALVILITGSTTPKGPSAVSGETVIALRTPAPLVDLLKHPVRRTRAHGRRWRLRHIVSRALEHVSWWAHRAALRLGDDLVRS